MRASIAALATAIAFAVTPVGATPPQTLSYQGFLTSASDAPIDASVQITFRLYNVPAGGAALWSETQASVTVSKGEFSTILGLVTPITLPFDVPYYLGVTVGSDAEMTPRQPLAASAYAFRAMSVDAGGTVPGSVITGSIPTATVPGTQVIGSITTATLPGTQVTGTITTATIAGSQVTGDLSSVSNIDLPNTTADPGSVGNIRKNGLLFLHNFGTNNTFLGVGAGNLTMTGSAANTAVGTQALGSNTLSVGNTAVGSAALAANTGGSVNTATGGQALTSNTTGTNNVAIGDHALYANTNASFNTAIGTEALFTQALADVSLSWTSNNTAVGAFALFSNAPSTITDGISNTAVGALSLRANTTGRYNVAVGDSALYASTTGDSNVAIGHDAINNGIPGAFNVAVGDSAGSNVSGSNNVAIGALALPNAGGNGNIAIGYHAALSLNGGSNNIVIGDTGIIDSSGEIRIGADLLHHTAFIGGINGVTTGASGVQVFVDNQGQLGTLTSSRSVKEDIADMGDASALLMKLRPVTFHYRNRPGWPLQYGLIAEEVAEVAPDLAARGPDGKIQTVYYQDLPPMLLNEFQKQQRVIQAQRQLLDGEHARIEALEREMAELKAMITGRR